MPISEARKRANEKWNKENPYQQVQVRLISGITKDDIKTHAEKHGESVNAFINRAIAQTMERDKQA